ncbi:hypothetical protein [Streptomyces chartreusis]|uniref:hypothetical protein n=1 Tax=Streptomyces chartreusis TaxID=1969 RepID=UPI0037F6081E
MGEGGGPGGGDVRTEVTEWVRKNGTAVKESDHSATTGSDTARSSSSSTGSNQSTDHRLDPSDVG